MKTDGEAAKIRETAEVRTEAWSLFESGAFAEAAEAFARLASLEQLTEPELRALVETLNDRGRLEDARAAIAAWLDAGPDATQAAQLAWAAELFGLSTSANVSRSEAAANGLRLLELAAATDDTERWLALAEDGTLAAIEAAIDTPSDLLDALEQESFAPEATGLPAVAHRRVEEIGRLHASEPALVRKVERLLHAAGERDAAYRVEHARQAAARQSMPTAPPVPEPRFRVDGLQIVIAGGHPALRSRVRRLLEEAGAAGVREIPSAKEASRLLRDVQATMAGADLAVVIAPQIAHSTSDQIRSASAKLGVPVVVAPSAGTEGIRRVIKRAQSERSAAPG